MRVYMTRKQCEQAIVAMTVMYGDDPEARKAIDNMAKVLKMQCKDDKSHCIDMIKDELK